MDLNPEFVIRHGLLRDRVPRFNREGAMVAELNRFVVCRRPAAPAAPKATEEEMEMLALAEELAKESEGPQGGQTQPDPAAPIAPTDDEMPAAPPAVNSQTVARVRRPRPSPEG